MPAGSAQGQWRTQILTPPYPVSTWQTPDSYSTLKACVLRLGSFKGSMLLSKADRPHPDYQKLPRGRT